MRKTYKDNNLIWLLLVAFLLNVVTPAYALSEFQQAGVEQAYERVSEQTGEAGFSATASLLGDKILICTGNGFKWISLSDPQDAPPNEVHPQFKCPLCYVSAHDLKIPLISQVLAIADVPVLVSAVVYAAPKKSPTSQRISRGFLTRAPPVTS